MTEWSKQLYKQELCDTQVTVKLTEKQFKLLSEMSYEMNMKKSTLIRCIIDDWLKFTYNDFKNKSNKSDSN